MQRAQKLLLLGVGRFQNEVAAGAQLGVGIAHLVDHCVDDLRQERLGEANALALIDRAAQDAAQDIRAAGVARQHAIGDQERHRAAVIGHGAVGREVRAVVRLVAAQQRDRALDDRQKQSRCRRWP